LTAIIVAYQKYWLTTGYLRLGSTTPMVSVKGYKYQDISIQLAITILCPVTT